jgi:hypothetical protein
MFLGCTNMKYYALEYPNHVRLLMKSPGGLAFVVKQLRDFETVNWYGTIYNTQSFLSLREIDSPSDREKTLAQELQFLFLGE